MKPSAIQIARAAILGVLYGLIVGGLAALMTGAGHGWSSGMLSAVGIPLIPIANVSRLFMHTLWGRLCAFGCLAFGIVVDAMILQEIFSKGGGYLGAVFRSVPHIFFAWLLLWPGWQLVLLAHCLLPSA